MPVRGPARPLNAPCARRRPSPIPTRSGSRLPRLAGAVLFGIILAVALGGGGSKNHQPVQVAEGGSDDGSMLPPPSRRRRRSSSMPRSRRRPSLSMPPSIRRSSSTIGLGRAEPPNAPPVVTHRPAPPSSSSEAKALYKQGVQLFVRGDAKGALAALQKSKAVNASYAPTWRVLGQVYRKLGEKGSAKNAFLRDLMLAPNASDAATVREQMNQL